VTVETLVALTRSRLAGRTRRVVPKGPLIQAAVLIPIIDRDGPCLVFAKRTDQVSHHRGQISFPGGRVAPDDASFLEAALREAWEEIGLPPSAVEPLGALDDQETYATNFVITPWVGLVREPLVWRPDGSEIEKVIEVPFGTLVESGAFRVEHWGREGTTRPVWFFDYEGETIWGATARILRGYLDALEGDGDLE
jgi:8-oxo-dGTP pyrophosphatase MutT (NUDIX family)